MRTIELSQPGLIEQVTKDIGFDDHSKGKYMPVDTILYANKASLPRRESWNYRSIIGK